MWASSIFVAGFVRDGGWGKVGIRNQLWLLLTLVEVSNRICDIYYVPQIYSQCSLEKSVFFTLMNWAHNFVVKTMIKVAHFPVYIKCLPLPYISWCCIKARNMINLQFWASRGSSASLQKDISPFSQLFQITLTRNIWNLLYNFFSWAYMGAGVWK